MSHPANDLFFESQKEWLEENYPEHEIEEDDRGFFITLEDEQGTPGEDGYGFRTRKEYLPANLQFN